MSQHEGLVETFAFVDIDPRVFSPEVAKRAAHRMMDRATFGFSFEGESLRVRITPKSEQADLQALSLEFEDELLDQDLRERVGTETRGVRDLILAHALSDAVFLDQDLESEVPDVLRGTANAE